MKLTEKDLVDAGFEKHEMPGTGWHTINSMRDSVYYYTKGQITINATEFWTWFLGNSQRNDIAVNSPSALKKLIKKYS